MKILGIGDPHAKRNNTTDIALLTEKICEVCDKEQPDIIVTLGDLGNDFARMHLSAWQGIVKFFETLSRYSDQLYYVVGNHDMENNQCFLNKSHFFNVFKNLEKVTVVDSVIKNGEMIFLPYVPPGRFSEALNQANVDFDKTKVIFCHQEFKGAKMGAIESKHGDTWAKGNPLVISGHIHDRDWLQSNILYVGAPYQTSFGDSQNKTVEIIEIVDGNVKTRPIDLNMPKKITLNVDVEKFKTVEVLEENRYRINVKGTSEELHKLKTTKKYKELSKIAKVIPKPADKLIVKKQSSKKGFDEIFHEEIQKESEMVKTEYQEVMESVYQT